MNTNLITPRFITIEGGEGAGKTTLIDHLEKLLTASGIEVLKTREPGGTYFGEQIRGLLLSPSDSIKIGKKAELLLFLAARAEHIEQIIAPALASGKVVICDRFNDSTIAYQGRGRGLGMSFVKSLCDTICGKILPDLTFYLDVDPKIGIERTKNVTKENSVSGTLDRIEKEKLEFHETIRQAFISIAENEPQRFYSINANQLQNEVWNDVFAILKDLYPISLSNV